MKDIYKKLWEKAKPIYQKSRPFDVKHIEWMLFVTSDLIESENLDESIFYPLVILHDIGYVEVDSNDFWKQDTRTGHMKAGASLAEKILRQMDYREEKIMKIKHYISIHDNWALGDNEVYKNDKLLAIFTDIDFSWMASKEAFPYFMKSLGKSKEELIEWLETNEKLTNRPFASKSTKELFEREMNQRRKED